jgi:hypothetical protein
LIEPLVATRFSVCRGGVHSPGVKAKHELRIYSPVEVAELVMTAAFVASLNVADAGRREPLPYENER